MTGKLGRQPYPLETMLRIHFMPPCFNLSDPAMEDALHDSFSICPFARRPGARVPDETTILNFRHRLEANNVAEEVFDGVNLLLQDAGLMVRRGTIVDATIIDAPSSTKNAAGARDPEMHQTKKSNNYFFGIKAHIGVDLHTGLVHAVVGTAANVANVTQVGKLLHGKEDPVFGDAGYQGVHKCTERTGRNVQWFVVIRPSKIAQMKHGVARVQRDIEHLKARLRTKVEHSFRVIERQSGYTKTRCRGLAKTTTQLKVLFALSNLWMARRHWQAAARQVRDRCVLDRPKEPAKRPLGCRYA